MTIFNMKSRIIAAAAFLLCCISCIEKNNQLGGNLVPIEQTYTFYTAEFPLDDIDVLMADSLSGYSSTRVTIGSIHDEEYGTTERGCAITLVPIFDKAKGIDFGKNPKFNSFHFALKKDTLSMVDPSLEHILQNVNVYELSEAIDPEKDFDINKPIKHGSKRISKGTPVYNGGDSLSFNFSKEFGERFLTITSDELKSFSKYIKRFPGIYIDTPKPLGNSGRIDMFELQLDWNNDYQYIEGNVASLSFNSEYRGVRKDTSIFFYYSATNFYDIDSLFQHSGRGSFPQYCLNASSHQTRTKEGKAKEDILIEGGGGLKPRISAKLLKKMVEDEISSKGGIPSECIINKASLVFPYEFPKDYSEVDNIWPDVLSPTCRVIKEKTTTFMGLTDSSSSDENQGDNNRSIFQYAPDITYHMQELLKIDESKTGDTKTKMLNNGSYDIWLLIMASEEITTSSGSNNDMSEYYKYLAYQSYYASMYGGGYGGYGGYGGGYGDYYSNYYSYMMMAQYASSANTSTSTQMTLDTDRFYKAKLNGPEAKGKKPCMKIVYGVPSKAD